MPNTDKSVLKFFKKTLQKNHEYHYKHRAATLIRMTINCQLHDYYM